MKNYDPNITCGIHTIRITLQKWDYVGHIIQKINGNCKGRTIIDFDFECEDEFPDNDCGLAYIEAGDYFFCVLKNESGDRLQGTYDAEEMNDMIVAIEILDFKELMEEEQDGKLQRNG